MVALCDLTLPLCDWEILVFAPYLYAGQPGSQLLFGLSTTLLRAHPCNSANALAALLLHV